MSFNALIPALFGVGGLVAAYFIYQKVKEFPTGEAAVARIGDAIHLGAMVFIRREYGMLGIFAAVLVVVLFFTLGWKTAFAFLIGAVSSGAAGYIGMNTATRANVRTTTAAHSEGAAAALTVAFFGGSIMGLAVASLGLIGLGTLYLFFGGDPETAHVIHGFGMGASSVALFSRVGGGIFTKSADVGADLVGKLEAGIPEDDPRNPGVIADNVGDNVGDVAGMGSDIFESYCGAMIATIAIASTMAVDAIDPLGERAALMFLPLALASAGLLCSIAGIFMVQKFAAKSPETALRIGTIGATVLFMVLSVLVIVGTGISTKVWGRGACRCHRGHHHRTRDGVFHGGATRSTYCHCKQNRRRHCHHHGACNRYAVGDHPVVDHLRDNRCCQRVGGFVRRGHRCGRYACDSGDHHGNRCLRTGCRQCGWYRGNGWVGRRHAQNH